ncbi:hypothetical protein OESDEN_01910 [Oesophagostomum dentatum]|uniref:Uncharacterized protein n=1 Tax=Oesophagostomum dentatum TaxID=61180 RepID=A0A0B1TRV0_OESDE|nr:hypothetical protein OESDEN_01910 [Oesophagostomum dentatum]
MSPLRQAFTLADDDLAALHLLYPMKGKVDNETAAGKEEI